MLFNILAGGAAVISAYLLAGAGYTYIYRKKCPLKKLQSDGKNKKVYLTFDDGIDEKYTPELLELLQKEEVKATFFVVASTVRGNGHILKEMKEAGHTVGMHSYEHKNQILMLPHQVRRDFHRSLQIFKEADTDIRFYRPPWGHIRPYGEHLCRKQKIIPVHWTVIVGDWKGNITYETILKRLREEIRDNSVVCIHDGRGTNEAPSRTIQALRILIPQLKEEGYEFEKIDTAYEEYIM